MEYGLVGAKLGHSFSPELHRAIGGYEYGLTELTEAELTPFFRARAFRGVNVTIPYKSAVIPLLDEVSPEARRIGAVNTVVNRGGRLFGYNTDYDGMRYLIERTGIDLFGRRVLILGSGGTSLTALALAHDLGAAQVRRVSRTPRGADIISYAEAAEAGAMTDVLIDTTSVGMYPNCEGEPVNLDDFPHLTGVVGAVYRPLRSTLVERARERGIPAAGGLSMLVAQGVRASEYFRHVTYPAALCERLCRETELAKSHLILIGMPGAGKSTVGARLARRLGRPFFDTDEEVKKRAGCDIPTLFATRGEAYFRDLEAEAVRDIALKNVGAVIATGGGVPLREDNRLALRRTGRVLWLSRPLDSIRPTNDRPLARDREALARRYAEREPIYRRMADEIIPVGRTPDDTVATICEVLL